MANIGTVIDDTFTLLGENGNQLTLLLPDGQTTFTGQPVPASSKMKAAANWATLAPGGWYVINGTTNYLVFDGSLFPQLLGIVAAL
jgi:hypothetical protein